MKHNTRISQVLRKFEVSDLASAVSLSFGDEEEFRVEIANDLSTRIQAYRLLYCTYVEKEFAKPHSSKMWYSVFDAHPDTATIVVKKGVRVVGALTIVIDSVLGLPSEALFKKELDCIKDDEHKIAEIISLGIDSGERGASKILEKLFNLSYLYARGKYCVDTFVITVNPRHSSFYQKKLLFEPLGKIKDYDRVSGMPAAFLTLDLLLVDWAIDHKNTPQFKRVIYKSFFAPHESSDLLKEFIQGRRLMNEQELKFFFVQQKNIFSNTSSASRSLLQTYYPKINLSALEAKEDSGFMMSLSL